MPTNDFLPYISHHGILGQKWGVRRYQNADGSLTDKGKKRYAKKVDKIAKKDAEEYARAKMFYGKGAGTRRKLIKATVEERSRDKVYKESFDKHLSNQSMSEHAEKAKAERKRKDISDSAKKTTRGVVHTVLRDGAKVSVGAAAIGTAAIYAHQTGIDRKIFDWGKKTVSQISRRF